jgi:hypothetical protein
MWRAAGTARWRVGTRSLRLLSPSEIVANREQLRRELGDRVAKLKKGAQVWPVEHLDVFAHDELGRGMLAWDVRQPEDDCFDRVGSEDLGSRWSSSLSWILATGLTGTFVEALEEKLPEIKKLKLGQPVGELANAKSKKAAGATKQPKKKKK